MVRWLQFDELLRTDDQLMDEMVEELGFERRGARIVARIQEAIGRSRAVSQVRRTSNSTRHTRRWHSASCVR